MKMQLRWRTKQGFNLRSILIHSLWITVTGILLFRLATANTQGFAYVEIFAVSGVVLATAPWIIQLAVTTAIILLYRTGVCDLMWVVRVPSSQSGSKTADEEAGGMVHWQGKIDGNKGLAMVAVAAEVDRKNGPRLQRNRTI